MARRRPQRVAPQRVAPRRRALGLVLLLAVVVLVTDVPGPSAPRARPAPDPPRIAAVMHPLAPGERPPQFVILSFDGVGSHEHWQRIMAAAAATQAHVTGLLSGVYLLPDAARERYRGPGHAPGRSSIGFGGSPAEVSVLIDDLNAALRAGHEIGTHYNGHFCQGAEPSVGRWTTAMWDDELDQFFAFVATARAQGLQLDPATVKGSRTPCLEGNWAAAVPAMVAHGLTYDTSRTSDGPVWPYQAGGIRVFPMPVVNVPALGRKAILMDYNLWFSLNGARDEPARAVEFAEVTLEAYQAAYQSAFDGNRAPLVIGNHFNDWSGGGFAVAVTDFMTAVCTRPETVCATYSEVSAWMDMQAPQVLAALRDPPAVAAS